MTTPHSRGSGSGGGRRPDDDDPLVDPLDPDTIEAALEHAEELPDPEDYRHLRTDYPPGGETTREQGFGAPEDVFPPAEQSEEEYAETPAGAPGGEMSPDEPDFPPPEGRLPDDETSAVTLRDAYRDFLHGEPTFPAPLGVVPPLKSGPRVPREAIDVMTEERSDTHDPSEELERCEEDPEYAANSPTCGADEVDAAAGAADPDLDEKLDEAVMETFPASDPIAPATRDRTSEKKRR